MGVLDGLKRILSLRSSRDSAEGALERRSASATAAANSRGPAQRPQPLQRSNSQPSPAACPAALELELSSPRRIPLYGMPAELAALERQFAALPAHQVPNKAAVAARLGGVAQEDGPSNKQPTNKAAGSRSPRKAGKGTKGLRRPAVRASLQRQRSSAAGAAASSAAAAAQQPGSRPPPAREPATAAADPAQRSKRSKLAHLKQQRQARQSADGQARLASPRQATAGLLTAESSRHSSVGLEAEASGWTARTLTEEAEAAAPAPSPAPAPHSEQHAEPPHHPAPLALPTLTPRAHAAVAAHAQPRSHLGSPTSGVQAQRQQAESSAISAQPEDGGAVADNPASHSGRCSDSSHSDLGATLAPWAAEGGPAPVPPWPATLPTAEASLPPSHWLPALGAQATAAAAAAAAAAAEPAEGPASATAALAAAGSMPSLPHSSHVLRPRLSRGELPPDLLSLRESASLARHGALPTGRQLAQKGSGHSEQEPARTAEGQHTSRKGSSLTTTLPESSQAARHDASAAAAGEGGQVAEALGVANDAGEGSEAAKRLAMLRRNRRPGWNSDFNGTVPGWQHIQETEMLAGPSAQDATTAKEQDGHSAESAAAAGTIATVGTQTHPAPAEKEQPKAEGTAMSSAASETIQQPAPPRPRPRGMTQAQLRQQEAWGSLAGLTLEDMLKQPPRAPPQQQQTSQEAQAADLENSMAGSNTGSPSAVQLQTSPKHAQHDAHTQVQPVLQTGEPASRQGRRWTAPQSTFVESLERLAALHRARSDSEQQEGSIHWKLHPAMRRSRSPPRQQAVADQRLPPLGPPAAGMQQQNQQHAGAAVQGTSAAQPHDLRLRSGHLANARRRGTWKQPQVPVAPQEEPHWSGPELGQQADAGDALATAVGNAEQQQGPAALSAGPAASPTSQLELPVQAVALDHGQSLKQANAAVAPGSAPAKAAPAERQDGSTHAPLALPLRQQQTQQPQHTQQQDPHQHQALPLQQNEHLSQQWQQWHAAHQMLLQPQPANGTAAAPGGQHAFLLPLPQHASNTAAQLHVGQPAPAAVQAGAVPSQLPLRAPVVAGTQHLGTQPAATTQQTLHRQPTGVQLESTSWWQQPQQAANLQAQQLQQPVQQPHRAIYLRQQVQPASSGQQPAGYVQQQMLQQAGFLQQQQQQVLQKSYSQQPSQPQQAAYSQQQLQPPKQPLQPQRSANAQQLLLLQQQQQQAAYLQQHPQQAAYAQLQLQRAGSQQLAWQQQHQQQQAHMAVQHQPQLQPQQQQVLLQQPARQQQAPHPLTAASGRQRWQVPPPGAQYLAPQRAQPGPPAALQQPQGAVQLAAPRPGQQPVQEQHVYASAGQPGQLQWKAGAGYGQPGGSAAYMAGWQQLQLHPTQYQGVGSSAHPQHHVAESFLPQLPHQRSL